MKGKVKRKVIFILIVAIIVCLFLNTSLQKYTNNATGVLSIIGEPVTNNEITVSEYVALAEKTVGVFLKYMRNDEIEKAYSLLTPEYKQVVTQENFKTLTDEMDFASYRVVDIVAKTQNMYVAYVETGDNQTHQFLIILNDEKFAVVPEPFLKYVEVNNSITKDGVTYTLKGYQMNVSDNVFYVTIKNENNEKVTISSTKMYTDVGVAVYADNGSFSVEENSTVEKTLHVQADIEVPVSFEIERDAGNKIRTYNFKLD